MSLDTVPQLLTFYADVVAMIEADFMTAERPLPVLHAAILVSNIVADIAARELNTTTAIMEHRDKWRAALGLPRLTVRRDDGQRRAAARIRIFAS